MKPLTGASVEPQSPKKEWELPAIVLEYSLVAKAQGPILGGDQEYEKIEEDPFLGAFTASGV